MAKALIGYVGGPTVDQSRETARLRQRVRDLEAETLRLKVENDALNRALGDKVEQLDPDDVFAPLAR